VTIIYHCRARAVYVVTRTILYSHSPPERDSQSVFFAQTPELCESPAC